MEISISQLPRRTSTYNQAVPPMRPHLPYCRTSTSTHRECRRGCKPHPRIPSLRRRKTSPHISHRRIRTTEVVSTRRKATMPDTCRGCRMVLGLGLVLVSTLLHHQARPPPGRPMPCRPNPSICPRSCLTRNATIKCDCNKTFNNNNSNSNNRSIVQHSKLGIPAVHSIPWPMVQILWRIIR